MEYVRLELLYDAGEAPPEVRVEAFAPVVGIGYQRRGADMNFVVEADWEGTLADDLDTRFPDNIAPAP